MATLIGVLVDVSGSMSQSIGDRPAEQEGSWARSIFRVVDGLIKHDVSSRNKVFAIAYGAASKPRSLLLILLLKIYYLWKR